MLGTKRKLLRLSAQPEPAVWDTVTQAAATIRAVTWAIPAYTAPDGSPGLCEAAVYDTSGVLLGRSGARDLPPGGTTVTFSLLPIVWGGGNLVVSVWLSGSAASRVALASDTFPALSGKPRLADPDGGLGDIALVTRADYVASWVYGREWWHEADGPVFSCGADADTGEAWGTLWSGGWLAKSADAGTAASGAATWTTMMALPSLSGGEAIYWLEIDRSSTPRLIALTSLGRILVTDNLTAGATWTDVTPSIKRANGIALAWCMCIWQGKVWAGEYTAAPYELAGGPYVYSCPLASLSSGGWTLSLLVANGRHIHAVQPDTAGNALYAVAGDAGFDGIGIWRLAVADIGSGPGDGGTGSADAWEYVAPSGAVAAGDGRPSVYPVSVIPVRGVPGVPDVLIGSGDQPGTHVTVTPLGSAGAGEQFAVGVLLKQPNNGESGETARAVLVDESARNLRILYWTSAEVANPANHVLYGSPPPYAHAHALETSFPGLIMRSVYLPGWTVVLNARQRWAAVSLNESGQWDDARLRQMVLLT